MLEQQIEKDIKTALLAGEKQTALTLRGLKSTILYAKVAGGKRDSGLTDDEVIAILSKESKKRQESADLYKQGGSPEREAAELAEKQLIDNYLPAQLSEAEVLMIVNEVVADSGATDSKALGQVIGQVKAKVGAGADGALIARLVKERLTV